jgi:hypothetical protein
MTPASWTDTVGRTDWDEVIRDEADKDTWDWRALHNGFPKTDEFQEVGYKYSGLGYPSVRNAGEPMVSQDMVERGNYTFTSVELAMGVDIDILLLQRARSKGLKGQSNFVRKISTGVGEAFKQIKNVYAARFLIYATDATNQPLFDDYALATDSYTTEDGTSVDNKLAVAALGYSSQWDMVDWLRVSQYSYKGLRQSCEPAYVVYYPTQDRTYQKIYNQDWQIDSSDRNKNFLKTMGVKLVPCVELTDTAATYMMGEEFKKYLIFQKFQGLTTKWEDNPRNRTRSALCHCILKTGVRDRLHFVMRPGS